MPNRGLLDNVKSLLSAFILFYYGVFQIFDLSIPFERAPSKLSEIQKIVDSIRTLVTELQHVL